MNVEYLSVNQLRKESMNLIKLLLLYNVDALLSSN